MDTADVIFNDNHVNWEPSKFKNVIALPHSEIKTYLPKEKRYIYKFTTGIPDQTSYQINQIYRILRFI